MNKNEKKMTAIELKYWRCIKARSGVVFMRGAPGLAKSAISRSIAEKLGLDYIDLRLSQKDETDVGVYPTQGNRNGTDCVKYLPPEWAVRANEKPCLIHFEELNRSRYEVRNAALQLLLERQIGEDFKFNDNVYMMSSGNMGEEDGCDVEELDRATNGRLIHFEHTLNYEEWMNGYARKNVIPLITDYLKAHPDELYNMSGDDNKAYASPRSWTFLSDFVKENFGEKYNMKEVISALNDGQVCTAYIGKSSVAFLRYCEDMCNMNINDVLNRYDDVKENLENATRAKISELTSALKSLTVDDMTKQQITNLDKFLSHFQDDEKMSYILHLLEKEEDSKKCLFFFNKYRNFLSKANKNMNA